MKLYFMFCKFGIIILKLVIVIVLVVIVIIYRATVFCKVLIISNIFLSWFIFIVILFVNIINLVLLIKL